MRENFDSEKEGIFFLNIDVGEAEPYLEIVIAPKDTPVSKLRDEIRKYLKLSDGKRSSDDEITEYLIKKGIVIDTIKYTYINV